MTQSTGELRKLIAQWRKTSADLSVLLAQLGREVLLRNQQDFRINTLLAIIFRCSRTNMAIHLLSNPQFLTEVSTLTRTLIENAVTGCYLQIASDDELNSFRYFQIVVELRNQAVYEDAFGPLDGVSDEMRAQLKSAQNQALAKSKRSPKAQTWTDVSVRERAELVDRQVGCDTFTHIVKTAYLAGHSHVHPTGFGIQDTIDFLTQKHDDAEDSFSLNVLYHSAALCLFGVAWFVNQKFNLSMKDRIWEAAGPLR